MKKNDAASVKSVTNGGRTTTTTNDQRPEVAAFPDKPRVGTGTPKRWRKDTFNQGREKKSILFEKN
jgi:hypothetical protein